MVPVLEKRELQVNLTRGSALAPKFKPYGSNSKYS
jgi:hypothetical protein